MLTNRNRTIFGFLLADALAAAQGHDRRVQFTDLRHPLAVDPGAADTAHRAVRLQGNQRRADHVTHHADVAGHVLGADLTHGFDVAKAQVTGGIQVDAAV